MNELKIKVFKYFKEAWYVPVMIILGVILMVAPIFPQKATVTSAATAEEIYLQEIQQRVESMVMKIDGAGECSVTVTLGSGIGKEYVRENGNVLVITDTDGNQVPVVSREMMPEIAGVTVVCGAQPNVTVQNDIVRSISTLLGIGTNKVCVLFYGEE
jgi:hypothetical protein